MAISAADVKKLRDTTGAGMMAEKILKEMGLAAVAKRQDRATENGRVFVKTGNGKAVVLSLSCETDFVAQNKDFAKLGDDLCTVILEKGYTEINEELEAMVNNLIAIIKENMHLVKFQVFDIPSTGYASTYIHGDGAVAVLVVLDSDKPEIFKEADVEDFAHNLALHAAAYKPQFLNEASVDKAYEEEQLGIFRKQVETDEKLQSKPDKVKEGIVRGKLSKLYKEICFLDQAYVKDDSKSISQMLSEVGKAHGASLAITAYCVYQAGVSA